MVWSDMQREEKKVETAAAEGSGHMPNTSAGLASIQVTVVCSTRKMGTWGIWIC